MRHVNAKSGAVGLGAVLSGKVNNKLPIFLRTNMPPDFTKIIQIICPHCCNIITLPPRPPRNAIELQWLTTADFDIKCEYCNQMIMLDSEFNLRKAQEDYNHA